MELINQSDPGHDVDQLVAALKHNKVRLSNGKLLSSTNKRHCRKKLMGGSKHGRKVHFRCVLNLTEGKSPQTSHAHIPVTVTEFYYLHLSVISVCQAM